MNRTADNQPHPDSHARGEHLLTPILAELQQGHGTAGKILKDDALYDDLRKTSDQAHQLIADLQAGRGTAGKLLKAETLYNKVNQLIAKVDTTVDKLNAGQGTLGQLLVNHSESLTFTGCGTAQYTDFAGTVKDVSLSRCF